MMSILTRQPAPLHRLLPERARLARRAIASLLLALAIAAPASAYTARGNAELALERQYSSYDEPPSPAELYYSSYGEPETLSRADSDEGDLGWPLIVLAGTSAFALAAVGRRHVVVRRRHRTIPT
jgi:hypothetical protein